MVKKRIIDWDELIAYDPVSGKPYIELIRINDMPLIDIKEVKILGKIRGEKKDIELSMSKKIFFDWIDKLQITRGQSNE